MRESQSWYDQCMQWNIKRYQGWEIFCKISFFFFRILKLLNQRKLETLKERWWNQNPQKKVSLLSCVCGWRPSLIWYIFEREKINPLKKKSWSKKFPCAQACEEADDNSGGISIHNIGGVFIVIFIGIGLAIVTLAAEYWSTPCPPFPPVPPFPGDLIGSFPMVCDSYLFCPGTTSIKPHQRELALSR